LSPRCADPFYRKAIRVSTGAVFVLPILRAPEWPAFLLELGRLGFARWAAVVEPVATPIERLVAEARPSRVALLLGSEGPGLSAAARSACDREVTIALSPRGVDSLNVATAGAILLHRLLR